MHSECNSGRADALERKCAHGLRKWVRPGARPRKCTQNAILGARTPRSANVRSDCESSAPGRQNAKICPECINSGRADAPERQNALRLQIWARLGARTRKLAQNDSGRADAPERERALRLHIWARLGARMQFWARGRPRALMCAQKARTHSDCPFGRICAQTACSGWSAPRLPIQANPRSRRPSGRKCAQIAHSGETAPRMPVRAKARPK